MIIMFLGFSFPRLVNGTCHKHTTTVSFLQVHMSGPVFNVSHAIYSHRTIYPLWFKNIPQKRGSSYHLMRNTSSPCLSVEPMMHSGSG